MILRSQKANLHSQIANSEPLIRTLNTGSIWEHLCREQFPMELVELFRVNKGKPLRILRFNQRVILISPYHIEMSNEVIDVLTGRYNALPSVEKMSGSACYVLTTGGAYSELPENSSPFLYRAAR
jgi:hypothetical protein